MTDFSKYEGLIFDCDGTLTHSMPIHYVAWRETMNLYGISFSEDQFYAMAGMPSEKVIRTLATEQQVELEDYVLVAEQKETHFLRNIHELQPLNFTVDIARKYHGQIPLAVASGGNYPVVTAQLEHLGILSLFQAVVTAEHTQNHKPHPDVFLEAAQRMGIRPEKCLVFEDADLGIEAARRASMDCIDVREYLASSGSI